MDFIEDYVSITTKYTDAPAEFIEAGGYFLVSHLLGRYFKCFHTARPMRPNLWILTSSIPGRMRRSTVLSDVQYVYKKALTNFYDRIGMRPNAEGQKVEKVDVEKYIKKVIESTMIEEGTPEGIMDYIEATDFNEYALMSPEFGGVLKKMTFKEYQVGTSQLLSKLYYGEGGSMLLSMRGQKKGARYVRPGLYVTMYASMQEPEYYLTPEMVRQGLMRRILIAYIDVKDITMDKWKGPIGVTKEELYTELEQLAKRFTEKMLEWKDICLPEQPIPIHVAPSVHEDINKFAYEHDASVLKFPDNANIYRQSLWEHLAKLSMTKAIAKGKLEIDREGNHWMNARPEDFLSAKQFLERLTKNIEAVLSTLAQVKAPVRTFEQPLDRIYRFILSAGPEGIQRGELYGKAKMLSDELEKVLTTLQDQGRIAFKTTHVGPKKTPAVVYFSKEFAGQ